MNYGRIRRGPMAADAFTQIKNTLFRDTRLSFRDKGVFGLISTHRDGFGVSAESIAACSPTDGVSAVKTSLRNLEQYGYLRRTRERNPNGTLGGAVYFITDDPSMFVGPGEQMQLEMPSSQPAVPQPPLAEPTLVEPTLAEPAVVQPTVANHLHKKTNSKHTSQKNTLSPPEPQEPPIASGERETDAPPDQATTAQRIVRVSGVVAVEDEQAFIAWVRAKHPPAGPQFWRTVAAAGDLPELAEAWRADQPSRPGLSLIPDWCQHCNRGKPPASIAERLTETPDGRLEPCRDCHPARRAAA